VPDSPLKALEARLGLHGCSEQLDAALARSSDPTGAPLRAAQLLEVAAEADQRRLAGLWSRQSAAVCRMLTTLCGAAPFFVPILVKHPDWFFALAQEDFGVARTRELYDARLAEHLAGVTRDAHPDVLRRFKYYELARITVRELSTDLVPAERAAETLRELSDLADALLASAFALAGDRLAERSGPARWRQANGDELRLGFVVLGLGKLGGHELNYSSDVDLIYVFESPPERSDGSAGELSPVDARGAAPPEHFARLAQEFGRIVTASTPEGFLYRIDLDLRPDGNQGPLVASSYMLTDYYEASAATWEKAAFMKARPVAGDLELGWRLIRAIDPMIYRSSMDYEGVAAIKELKSKVEHAKAQATGTFNVKLSAGGIRDVESVAQALQLLHGGRIPEVRVRSTEATLIALSQVGILPVAEAEQLLAGYRFLRRTENRLQMVAERQTHVLPTGSDELERLARAMDCDGTDPAGAFAGALAEHRSRITASFAHLFEESGNERILALFARQVPRLLGNSITRRLIEELASRFAREVDTASDPQRAMNNLDRFIRGVGGSPFYYELLLDRPELVARLVALFASSQYLSSYFATHPRLIEPIFSDPEVLLHSRADLERNFDVIHRHLQSDASREDAEIYLEVLRLFHHREVLNVGLLDLDAKVTRTQVEAALTDIAEVCLQRALVLALAQAQRFDTPELERGDFLVVGMGKFATRELTYGSDLDVIFLYDVEGASEETLLEAQAYFVRVAQKLISALSTRTVAGVCYEIDARLRPSGNQGVLVVSLGAFERYQQESAQVWERLALLRARPVGGSKRLGRLFAGRRLEILRKPQPAGIAAEVHRIRQRAEIELGRERIGRHNFKTGRGGLQDIESIVQFLQLQHGARYDALLEVKRVAVDIRLLAQLDLLTRDDAETLRNAWEFFQRLSSRLRIVENRSISDLNEERGDLDALARVLGYPGQRPGTARRALLNEYTHHTSAVRALYCKVLGVEA
jgi:glutamate-ammonia-ligase adenylyltransferase